MANVEALRKERESCIYGHRGQPVWLQCSELDKCFVKGAREGSKVIQDFWGHTKGLEFHST